MSKKDGEKPNKLSRRDFLRTSFLGGVGFALGIRTKGLREATASPVPSKESANKSEWDREKILMDPLGFIDFAIEKIKQLEKSRPQSVTPVLRNFVEAYSAEENPGIYARPLTERLRMRKEFAEGFKLYGKRVSELTKRIDAIAPVVYDPAYQSISPSFAALGIWYESLELLNDVLDKPERIPEFNFDQFDKLSILTSWFLPLSRSSTYEGQRDIYLQDALSSPSYSSLVRDIDSSWDLMQRNEDDREQDQQGVEEHRNSKRKKIFLGMVDIIHRIFPATFQGLSTFDFTDKVGRRAYNYRFQDIFLGDDFFRAIEDYELWEKNKGKESLIFQALRDIDLFGLVSIHELNHQFNLDNEHQEFWGVHPRDWLDYVEARLEFIEEIESFIHGDPGEVPPINSDELKFWFLDDLSAKNFGKDELRSEDDLQLFRGECTTIHAVLEIIEQLAPVEHLEMMDKSGIADFFATSGEKMENWVVRELNAAGLTPFGNLQQGRVDNTHPITATSGLSTKTLEEMMTLSDEVMHHPKLESWEKDQILDSLLEMKFVFLFGTYVLLDRLQREDMISKDKHPELFQVYGELRDRYIYDQLLHATVGPYGEYMPQNTYDTLMINPTLQMESSIYQAKTKRKELSGLFLEDIEKKTDRLSFVLEECNRKLLKTQQAAARVLGFSSDGQHDELTIFQTIPYALLDAFGPEFRDAVIQQTQGLG